MTIRKNKLIQLVHIAKFQLKMDDASYRLLLFQNFNKSSSKDLTVKELSELVMLFQSKGAKIRLSSYSYNYKPANFLTPSCRKLWSLWRSMYDENIVRDGSSLALNFYVKRVLKGSLSWNDLNDNDACVVIETLKKWKERCDEKNNGC